MVSHIMGVAVASALLAGGIGWFVAWRYGRRRALVVPVLAVAAAVVSVARAAGGDPSDALPRVAVATVFAGPAVAGALVGLVLARRKG